MEMIRSKPNQGTTYINVRTVCLCMRTRWPMSKNYSLNRSSKREYKQVMEVIRKVVSEHKSSLVPGVPQLNMCDNAVMVRN